MNRLLLAWGLGVTLCLSVTWAQQEGSREPHIGYLYPAGGQRGTTVRVLVGGQFLRGMQQVDVSGEGVNAKVFQHFRMPRRIDRDQRTELLKRMVEVKKARQAEMPPTARVPPLPGEKRLPKALEELEKRLAAGEAKPVKLPDHPLLYDLENKSLRELWHIVDQVLSPEEMQRKQPNVQIGEAALIEVTISPGATPGVRELRLLMPSAMTNPMPFVVGTLPEVQELEPNDPEKESPLMREAPFDPPVVVNGQIMPGDIDRFSFRAKKGQRLVVETAARGLVPFLPDAVPGWFQATVALYDAEGKEVAFADDYRFNPDPVLLFDVPADGVYDLEVRDSIFRGREDFVYRVSVGELPFITRMFPLGGRMGIKTVAEIDGWNLPAKHLELATYEGNDLVRRTALRETGVISNEVAYAVDNLPEFMEGEPNDEAGSAQRIALPKIVNGRIDRPGDADVFSFAARADDDMVVEVQARRLGSPIDAVIRLMDASGNVLQWNDDQMLRDSAYLHRDMGTQTHHADPYLAAKLPEDGTYYVQIADTQNQGGPAFAYRLRMSAPRPDFELRMAPSSLSARAGQLVPFTVYALRSDGFDGEIDVSVKDATEGFIVEGGRIPAGRDRIRMTLRTPEQGLKEPVALQLEGSARIGGATVSRPVAPAEDVMQAFLFRHLLPSRELLVAVTGAGRGGFSAVRAGEDPVRIPAGGSALVVYKISSRVQPEGLDLVLQGAPEGLTIQDVNFSATEISFNLQAEGAAAKVGFADNAIVEVFAERPFRPRDKDGNELPEKTRRIPLGVLPAVPYVIVGR
jgi:hypothetical protein